jgi:solute carrier family 25 phosphate transporter 23/24/25/41
VKKGEKQSTLGILGLGATAGIVAQSVCYPLDTVRRRMQMKGTVYPSKRRPLIVAIAS